jgi:hypothetical protein
MPKLTGISTRSNRTNRIESAHPYQHTISADTTKYYDPLKLPDNIFLYLQTVKEPGRESFFIKPGTYMAGMLSQTELKSLEDDDQIFPILQSRAEPGTGFGMFIYTSKAGVLPHPCETSGSDLFKIFLFNALNTHPDFKKLDVTDPTQLEFQFISMSTGPTFPIFTPANFDNGGEFSRLYGRVLMAVELAKEIENDKKYNNDIFIVSGSGMIELKKKVGGRKRKTKKQRKSKKTKKTRKSRSRSKVRN